MNNNFPQINIVLLNWNGFKDTLECLESLKQIDYPNYKVVLVDNHSSGNDVEIITKHYGNYISKLIVTEKNLGFSGGNNVGINYSIASGAEYILLLNNDTTVEPDFLAKLFDSCKTTEIGIATPMITYYSDKNKIWSAGGTINKFKASGFTYGRNKESSSYTKNRYCTFASGCCLMIRKEVINSVGLLDENYFLYLEDTDYCNRVIEAGYKISYVGESKVYHKVNSTTSKSNALMPLYYSARNRFYFAKKNFGLMFYFSFFYLVLAFTIKWIFMYKDKNETALILIKALKDFLNNDMGQSKYFSIQR